MSKTDNLTDFLTDVANAIRGKKGTTAPINPQNFSDEIASIQSGSGTDRLQWKCDNVKTLEYEFRNYLGESLDGALMGLDTSNVTSFGSMFYGCAYLTSTPILDVSSATTLYEAFRNCYRLTHCPISSFGHVPNINYVFCNCNAMKNISTTDFSGVVSAQSAFEYCRELTDIPERFNFTACTNMKYTFYSCAKLTSLDVDTTNAQNMESTFGSCNALETLTITTTSNAKNCYGVFMSCLKLITINGEIDLINATSVNNIFNNCKELKNITLKNIKMSLQIGSGTSWGHNLSLDSLINAVKELWDYSSGTTTYTLTMGSANLAKITNTYVKLITPTQEQIDADPYIESKMPCEVCESTDEGAMLIKDYALLKNWSIN